MRSIECEKPGCAASLKRRLAIRSSCGTGTKPHAPSKRQTRKRRDSCPMANPPFQWQVIQAVLDPVQGSEQAGERPMLLVSHEALNAALTIATLLPMTTCRPGRRIYSTEVLLPAGCAGQPNDSRVMAHQIRTVTKQRLGRSYGWLRDNALREQVRTAMQVQLDLG